MYIVQTKNETIDYLVSDRQNITLIECQEARIKWAILLIGRCIISMECYITKTVYNHQLARITEAKTAIILG